MAYSRRVKLLTDFTVLLDPVHMTMSADHCASSPSYTLVREVDAATYFNDTARPGRQPPWCLQWGAMGFPRTRPSGVTVTLRSVHDPVVAAGRESQCSFNFVRSTSLGTKPATRRGLLLAGLLISGLSACIFHRLLASKRAWDARSAVQKESIKAVVVDAITKDTGGDAWVARNREARYDPSSALELTGATYGATEQEVRHRGNSEAPGVQAYIDSVS